MKKIARFFVIFFLLSLIILITLPATVFAPTSAIKLLGANPDEQKELNNFSFFETPEDTQQTKVLATSYLIMDLDNLQTISQKRSDSSLPIASLTKLITSYVVLTYGDLDDEYQITSQDLLSVSPSLGLKLGEKIKVKNLLQGMLIGSCNDAALSLSHYVGQKTSKEFSELMNEEAKKIGMNNSRFSNPMGFDSGTNYSTAHDLAKLVEVLYSKQIFTDTWRANSYQFTTETGVVHKTNATNVLISKYPDLKAIKTGFTNLSLGSMITVLEKEGKQYLIILIGSPDREGDTLKLRDFLLNKPQGSI